MAGKVRRQEAKEHQFRALPALVMSFLVLISASFSPLSYAWSDDDRTESLPETETIEQTEEDDPKDDPDNDPDFEEEEQEENAATQNRRESAADSPESEDFADMETLFTPPEADTEPEQTVLKSMSENETETGCPSLPAEDIVEEEIIPEPEYAPSKETILTETEEDFDGEVSLRAFAKSTATENRNIFRISISAEDLESTNADHAEYAITDQRGNIVKTLILSDDNQWQGSWEVTASAESSFSVEELGIYDSAGNDITGNWIPDPQPSEASYEDDHTGWEETDGFDDGMFLIEYESQGNKYLLAAENPYDNPKRERPYYYWRLTGEQSSPENASDAAIWYVTTALSPELLIKNEACGTIGYLGALPLENKKIYGIIRTSTAQFYSLFENYFLKSLAGKPGWIYLKAEGNVINCVAEAENPTRFNLYRFATFHDIIYENSVSFHHISLPPPVQKVNVTVRLHVKGNMGDYNRDFSFTATVNDGDAISFSLKHNGEYVLSDLPVGAKLVVSIDASGHTITSSFSDSEKGETALTVPSVPAGGGTVVFQAEREAKLDTGISSDTGPPSLIILITLLSYIALKPLIKLKAQKQFNRSEGENRP